MILVFVHMHYKWWHYKSSLLWGLPL